MIHPQPDIQGQKQTKEIIFMLKRKRKRKASFFSYLVKKSANLNMLVF